MQEVAVEYGDPTQACGSNIPLQGTPIELAHRNRNCRGVREAGRCAGYCNGTGFGGWRWSPATGASPTATEAGRQEDCKNHGKGNVPQAGREDVWDVEAAISDRRLLSQQIPPAAERPIAAVGDRRYNHLQVPPTQQC